MVGKRRGVVAGVVRRDDDVALRGKERCEQQRLCILQVGHVEGALGARPVRILDDRPRAGAARPGACRHHERCRCGGGLAGTSHRLVLDVVHEDVAHRRTAERQHLLVRGGSVQLGQQRRGRDCRQQLRWRLQQRAALRRSAVRARLHPAAAPAAAGHQQRCQQRQMPVLEQAHGFSDPLNCTPRLLRDSRQSVKFSTGLSGGLEHAIDSGSHDLSHPIAPAAAGCPADRRRRRSCSAGHPSRGRARSAPGAGRRAARAARARSGCADLRLCRSSGRQAKMDAQGAGRRAA